MHYFYSTYSSSRIPGWDIVEEGTILLFFLHFCFRRVIHWKGGIKNTSHLKSRVSGVSANKSRSKSQLMGEGPKGFKLITIIHSSITVSYDRLSTSTRMCSPSAQLIYVSDRY